MTHAWLFVGLAIIAEIAAALGLRFSDGFTKPMPTAFALIAFGAAFYLISLSLLHLPVSTVYPIWAGGGTAGVALVGVLMLKERAGVWKGLGVILVVAGIVTLNLSS
ncbi:MAG: multidrug efflux SMR transporter [Alphaproteobacteria bacterium]